MVRIARALIMQGAFVLRGRFGLSECSKGVRKAMINSGHSPEEITVKNLNNNSNYKR